MVVLLVFRMMSSIFHCRKTFLMGLEMMDITVFNEKFLFGRVLNFLRVCGTHVLLEGQDCRSFIKPGALHLKATGLVTILSQKFYSGFTKSYKGL